MSNKRKNMVRSRSETNLNRIFVDLCTSPEIRTKLRHEVKYQRQYHPPLPNLQPIKSNSCSNLNELEQNFTESTSSFASDKNEQRDIVDLNSLRPPQSTNTPLVPMESTGFTVQTTNAVPLTPIRSFKLFETLTINHTKKSSTIHPIPKDNIKKPSSTIATNPPNVSEDWKQQDFTNRLQNRLKSRGHLRKFFLS